MPRKERKGLIDGLRAFFLMNREEGSSSFFIGEFREVSRMRTSFEVDLFGFRLSIL